MTRGDTLRPAETGSKGAIAARETPSRSKFLIEHDLFGKASARFRMML
jgi:hypothetical protein